MYASIAPSGVSWSLHSKLLCSHLWSKDQSQDDRGPDKEPRTEDSCKDIDQVLQRVGGDDNHCQDNTGDVDGC